MSVRLSIKDAAFIPGRGKVDCGHLIWSEECPISFLRNLELNQGYRGMCTVMDQERVAFSGPALVKRRQHQGRDLLVFLLPDVDVGHLPPTATVEMNPESLEHE